MFDYYAMPDCWPGRIQSKSLPWHERGTYLETQLTQDIVTSMSSSFNSKQFIPYVQMHEFEALMFANTLELANTIAQLNNLLPQKLHIALQAIVDQAGSPEAINDSYETCPSRRITSFVPAYKKRLHGPIISKRIGIDQLRITCSNFGQWLSRLEKIA